MDKKGLRWFFYTNVFAPLAATVDSAGYTGIAKAIHKVTCPVKVEDPEPEMKPDRPKTPLHKMKRNPQKKR